MIRCASSSSISPSSTILLGFLLGVLCVLLCRLYFGPVDVGDDGYFVGPAGARFASLGGVLACELAASGN